MKRRYVTMAINNMVTKDERADHATQLRELVDHAVELDTSALQACVHAMMTREATTSELAGAKFPIHMVSGASDPLFDAEAQRQEAITLGATHTTVPGGHLSWLHSTQQIVSFIE